MPKSQIANIDLVPTVAPADLQSKLGYSERLKYEPVTGSLKERRMDVDDVQVIRYLMRNSQPRRHLEVGTWEGAGTVLVLEETNATVWTLNLWEGESTREREPAYSTVFEANAVPPSIRQAGTQECFLRVDDKVRVRTDAGGMIGRFYRQAGYGGRVCQIFSDSRRWDISNYPRNWFDTALIDGAHTPDIVISDTFKALALLKGGGFLLWHGYCPVPEVYQVIPSCTGVVAAIDAIRDELEHELENLWWIEDTWLLLGVVRDRP